MEDNLTFVAPEKVSFSVELAGLGSRFLAILIDACIQAAVLFGLSIIYIVAMGTVHSLSPVAEAWLTLGWVIVIFIFVWGYLVLFEGFNSGRTPGKKVAGIRVVTDRGRPIGPGAAVIRNLLRLADWLPFGYMVGMILVFFGKENKRLGDMAAGTLVVKESSAPSLHSLHLDDVVVSRRVRLAAGRLTGSDYELLRDFLTRRYTIEPQARGALADKLAAVLAGKAGIDITGASETCLEELAAAYQSNGARAGLPGGT